MMDYDKSYERYKQYRINKYTYEQELITFQITVIAVLMAIIAFWKQILIAIAVACAIILVAFVVYWYLKKQVTATEAIVIGKEDAEEGVTANINVKYKSSHAKIELDIPPNVKDGQKFVIRNVIFEDKNGKKMKKNLYLIIKIS